MKRNIKWFTDNLIPPQVHGKNILAKIRNISNLSSRQKSHLIESIKEYKKWHQNNNALIGYSVENIKKRTTWLNQYKNVIESFEFSAQSKFHSSVLEEFLFYLFKDLINEFNMYSNTTNILLGGTTAYSNLYFAPENLGSFIKRAKYENQRKRPRLCYL